MKNVTFGRNIKIHNSVLIKPPVKIGNNVIIKELSIIGPNTVIGSNVIIAGNTLIKDSRISDNTYVGSNLEIISKCLDQDRVISLSEGDEIPIVDNFICKKITSMMLFILKVTLFFSKKVNNDEK